MSLLFEPVRIGEVDLDNRIMHSATQESMADSEGYVTDTLLDRYRKLASSGIGLIVPGTMNVNPVGRFGTNSNAIWHDSYLPGLQRLTGVIHSNGSKVAFQLQHAGRQTFKKVIGQRPVAPSKGRMDPMFMARPRVMGEAEIESTIEDYVSAAGRAFAAGADGVQLHAGHGFLLNQFLSPFFNHRRDGWGGSDEKRFRFVREIVNGIVAIKPEKAFTMIKLSSNDFTPEEGITPPLAARYVKWLDDLGMDAVEVTCGTGSFSNMNIWRGDLPIKEMVGALPPAKRLGGWIVLKRMAGKFDYEEGYNLEAARTIRSLDPHMPLALVGGLRHVEYMEKVLGDGSVDLISMSRPFIRDLRLVEKLRKGAPEVSCVSCNKCLATTVGNEQIKCPYGE
jgi:2,4-dienoyl-CoA reductase-like NADH-dependent reductase (Old Yellow Enzyme family)